MDRKILVVSDSTGSTAEHVLRAALAQFKVVNVVIDRRPQTRTLEDIQHVVEEAHDSGAMLVHTLASTDLWLLDPIGEMVDSCKLLSSLA